MKKNLMLMIITLFATYANATEVCTSSATGSSNIFIFENSGLKAICQKIAGEVVSGNQDLCAGDQFMLTSQGSMNTASSKEKTAIFTSISTGVNLTVKKDASGQTVTLDKIYRLKVLSGKKEILIQAGKYSVNCVVR